MTQSDNFNQTAFASEEPLFESAGGDTSHKVAEVKKPNGGKVIVFFVICISLIGGWIYFRSTGAKIDENVSQLTPTPTVAPNTTPTSVDQHLLELDQSLKEADPSINLYPFPPVSEEILVSPKK